MCFIYYYIMNSVKYKIDTPNRFNNPKNISFTKKELTIILKNENLESTMNDFFKKNWIKTEIFSIEDFVEKTLENNSLIFKSLRDFLEEQWFDRETMRSNKEILSYRKQYIQGFDNQDIFLSRVFSSNSKEQYESYIKQQFYQIEKGVLRKFLLKIYFNKYLEKYTEKKVFGQKQIDIKKLKERVGVRCIEDLDRKLINKIDITTLSINDKKKLKKTFFYKKAFPHFCSYSPYSFKQSLSWRNPCWIFLYNENQLFYSKSDQENISAIDINENRDTSLYALNDFDFLLVKSIYRDKESFSLNQIKEKYKAFGTLEEKNWTWFFKRNEEILFWIPGNTEKPERIDDKSTREKKHKDADKILFDVIKLAREIVETNFPI